MFDYKLVVNTENNVLLCIIRLHTSNAKLIKVFMQPKHQIHLSAKKKKAVLKRKHHCHRVVPDEKLTTDAS